jgi:hypothetical protein
MGGLPPPFDAAFDDAVHLADGTMKSHLHKRALGNAGAAVAGVVIGGLVVVLFFFLCIWPIIRRSIQNYRERRHVQAFDDPETGDASHLAGDALTDSGFDRPRRLPSGDSLKPPNDKDDSHTQSRSRPAVSRSFPQDDSSSAPSKNLQWSSPHEDVRALSEGDEQVHLHQYQYLTYPASAMVAPGQSDEHQKVPSTARDGDTIETPPHVHQTYILKHTNEDYYDTSIPSEAFGMVTSPSRPSAAAPTRPRSTSITQQVKQLLHRKSTKDRTTSQGTVGSTATAQSIPQIIPSKQLISDEELVQSPIERTRDNVDLPSPTSAQPPAGTPISFPAELRLKASPSPPINPAPGTVNPMDIMPASTESELWHRTEHELHVSSFESPSKLPSFMEQVDSGHTPASSSQSPAEIPSDLVMSDYVNTGDFTSEQELAEKDDTVMTDMPVQNAMLNLSNQHMSSSLQVNTSRRPSNISEHSTPFPGAASTDASSHNTPSTLLDSPSPESMHSSDFRHSASPNLAQVVPSEKATVFRCDKIGCTQVFDQPHKLKHHQRYHSKDHKCHYPGCGKGFGTKTHLQRHINDRHEKKKKFHCAIQGCDYSRAGGKAFPRKDNWKRHMTKIHNMDSQNLPEPIEVE